MTHLQRVVCLAAEGPEILAHLGLLDRVVGISGHVRRPAAARALPKVGGFGEPDIAKVLDLEPDLVITTSDIQAQAAAELIRAGVGVLALNPHRLADVWRDILTVGGALGRQSAAEGLVASLQAKLAALRIPPHPFHAAPRIYFEEWPDPMIGGIGWVSDLIEELGGEDIFAELADKRLARERVVAADEVAHRRPDLILASWCGKRVDLASIAARPGWGDVPAVAAGAIHEIAADDILQTGPSLLEGARQIASLIRAYYDLGPVPR